MSDLIRISRLELSVHLGVPDTERARPQKICVSLDLAIGSVRAAAASDDVNLTVDYYVVSRTVKTLAESRPRRLIETLAEEIAAAVLTFPRVQVVTVLLEKFILTDAAAVSLTIRRSVF